MKILAIGEGPIKQAETVFPEADIVNMDADERYNPDVTHDAGLLPYPFEDNTFDGLFASHVFEHISYWRELDVMKEWTRIVKPGSEVHVIVPSWEWVSRNVLAEKQGVSTPGLKQLAFGGQTTEWDIHLNLFTMRQLRTIFEQAGLKVFRARTGMRVIMDRGKEAQTEQHYVAGRKG